MFKELKKISKSLFKENLVSYNLSPNKRRIIQLYFLYLSFQLYFIITFEASTNFIILKYSYIKLKINGPIFTKIFSSYYVSGDGILNSDCKEMNVIDLIWNDNRKYPIYYTCSLFRECKNII